MKFFRNIKLYTVIIMLLAQSALGSWSTAERYYSKSSNSNSMKRLVILELIEDKKYFSAIPLFKEYLITTNKNLDRQMNIALNKLILVTGVKQFEVLQDRFLKRTNAGAISFILAKKYLQKRYYSKSLSQLNRISLNDHFYPFAKNLEGTIQSIRNNPNSAKNAFLECIRTSGSTKKGSLNRDHCRAGLARLAFQQKNYVESDLLYLDIPKNSYIWPNMLFEEAWNSYYLKNYNRTLGKLVSYKAPVFDFIFNPEIEVLKALSYLKLCLYTDARNEHKKFYSRYYKGALKLRRFIQKYKNNYKFFYRAMLSFEQKNRSSFELLNTILKDIERDLVYKDLRSQIILASKEYEDIRTKADSRFKRRMNQNISEVIITHKKILGLYIKGQLISAYGELYKAFEGMSYIKLESLKKEKESLYRFEEQSKKRGDVKYIDKNDKQYFWNFNGEFWADELGDYVFALGSECKK